MSEAIAAGGPLAYLVLLLGAVGVLANLGFAGLAVSKRRVPLAAIVLVPMLTLLVGAVGALLALNSVSEAALAATDDGPSIALQGMWSALSVDWLARWAAAAALAAGAWGAAMGALIGTGEEPKLTPVAAAGAGFTSLVGAGLVAGLTAHYGVGSGGYAFAALFLVAGMGVAAAALRRSAGDDMYRVAGMRFTASMSFLFAVFHAGRALDIGKQIELFGMPNGPFSAITDLGKAVEQYELLANPPFTVAATALGVALFVCIFGFFSELGEVARRFTVFDTFGVVFLMALAGLGRMLEVTSYNTLHMYATHVPARERYKEMTSALGAAVITVGETAATVRPGNGGYGDILGMDGEEWVRKYAWDGASWTPDDTKVADAKIATDRPPLLAVDNHQPAKALVEILEKVGGKAFIQLRASEVKGGIFVPDELGWMQVTVLPIQLATERDLKTQLWTDAGAVDVMWGPTAWYGEGDDKEPLPYLQAAIANTQAKTLVISTGERRISDVIGSCLPYVFDMTLGADAESSTFTRTDRACAVTPDDMETLRKEAAGLWDLPNPTNVKATITLEDPGAYLTAAEVEDRIGRELGALGWCAETALKGGEMLNESMDLLVLVSKEGSVYDVGVDVKSKLQSPTILRCANRRFRPIGFTVPEPPATPVPEPAPVEGEEPPPPVPNPIIHVSLAFPPPPPA